MTNLLLHKNQKMCKNCLLLHQKKLTFAGIIKVNELTSKRVNKIVTSYELQVFFSEKENKSFISENSLLVTCNCEAK